jgi:hypothetical protein
MRRWLLRIAIIICFVGVVALVASFLHSSDLLSATKSAQVPQLHIENVAAYWVGPAATYAKPESKTPLTAPKLVMRGSSFDSSVEDEMLAGFISAYNGSRTATWNYPTTPQILLYVDLKDGSRIAGTLSPTTDRHPTHAEIVITPAKGSGEKPVTYRVDSPALAEAVAVMLAFEQGAGLVTADATANPAKGGTTTTTKKK